MHFVPSVRAVGASEVTLALMLHSVLYVCRLARDPNRRYLTRRNKMFLEGETVLPCGIGRVATSLMFRTSVKIRTFCHFSKLFDRKFKRDIVFGRGAPGSSMANAGERAAVSATHFSLGRAPGLV